MEHSGEARAVQPINEVRRKLADDSSAQSGTLLILYGGKWPITFRGRFDSCLSHTKPRRYGHVTDWKQLLCRSTGVALWHTMYTMLVLTAAYPIEEAARLLHCFPPNNWRYSLHQYMSRVCFSLYNMLSKKYIKVAVARRQTVIMNTRGRGPIAGRARVTW